MHQSNDSLRIKWPKVARKITQGSLAPLGADSNERPPGNSECPICFTGAALNKTACSSQPICTECFLRIRPPMIRVHQNEPWNARLQQQHQQQYRLKRMPTRVLIAQMQKDLG